MARGVQFTKDSAKRIASTVRSVEAAPTDLTTFRRRDRGGEGGVSFPWAKCSFGYKINPNGDNPAEVLINTGGIETGMVFVVFLGMSTMAWTVPIKFVLDAEETYIYAYGRQKPTGAGDPYSAFDAFVSKDLVASEYWHVFPLYRFTLETTGDPPVTQINDSETLILRFLNIETGRGGGGIIPDGDVDNPHLIWDATAEEWSVGKIMLYSDIAFGWSILADGKVRVTAGEVRHGTRTPISVGTVDITLNTSPATIYLEYDHGVSPSASIKQAGSAPVSTEEVYIQPLHTWTTAGGTAISLPIHHVGDVSLPGVFA